MVMYVQKYKYTYLASFQDVKYEMLEIVTGILS